MATEKNITMKQFNGTDYDILYPKTIASQIPDVYSKTEVLTTETLSKYGLTADKLPNDVFQQIKTLIDNVQASADGKARIQTGSYVGTGTYGADNPCSITFNFKPKFFYLIAQANSDTPNMTSILSDSFACFDVITDSYPSYNTHSTDANGFGVHEHYRSSNYEKFTCTRSKLVGNTFSWFSVCYWVEDRTGRYVDSSDAQYNYASINYYWIAIG